MRDTMHTAKQQAVGQIKVAGSILKRAVNDDQEALSIMFRQFIHPDEEIKIIMYLGIQGLWGIGTRSFACVTDKRVAVLKVGAFKEITYQDGFLVYVNSGIIYQPSKLGLYILLSFSTFASLAVTIFFLNFLSSISSGLSGIISFIIALPVGGLGLLLFWLIAIKLYYRLVKCGLVWWIREGVSVYVFSNRGMMTRANQLYRESMRSREKLIENSQEPI